MLKISLGPYRLDLPGEIDIDPVAVLLREVQRNIGNRK